MRSESPSPYRQNVSSGGRQEYASVRQAEGAMAQTYQPSFPRQSVPVRESAPSVSYARQQQASPSANVQMSSPRQSAPPSEAASVVRSAPAQVQARPSSSEGSSRSSNGGSSGGGNSRGRR
jgi:hypothetical protein